MDVREIIFPMPETVWTPSDFLEELVWIPYPNYNFDTIKSIYNDEAMEKEEQFLRNNQGKFDGKSRYNWGESHKQGGETLFRKTLLTKQI